MKTQLNIFLLLLLLPVLIACQNNKNKDVPVETEDVIVQKSTDKPSTHGMLVMGTETIYASHLPMFHSPHDYQILLSLDLDEKNKATYIADRKVHKDENVYTLAPEVFVLPEKVGAKGSFKANIYRGHFERGGVKILEDIDVKIADIVYFKQFEKDAVRPTNKNYLLFGNKNEQFLAHLISKKPDFDEIIQVTIPQKALELMSTQQYLTIEFPESETLEPFSWNSNKGKVTNVEQEITFTKLVQIYLEFGDLK